MTDGGTVKMMPGIVFVNGIPADIGEEMYKPLGKACYGSGHGALIADFYEKLKAGEPFPVNGEEGARSVKLILAAYRSSGAEVTV